MELKAKLESDLKDAMRASDDLRKRTLRMVIASIKNVEIDRQSKLDDPAIFAILQKEIKSRREVIGEAEKAKRPDLAQSAQDEISVLETYLPKAMSEEELNKAANEVIQEINATGPSDMGKVMKILLPRLQGQAPGDIVSKVVRELLQK
jgi:uncharacterized protein YqeY